MNKIDEAVSQLATELTDPPANDQPNAYVRYATAVSSTDTTVTITYGGSTTQATIRSLMSVRPAAGDCVVVLRYNDDSLAIGIKPLSTQNIWHNIGAVGEPAFTNSWANAGGQPPARFTKTGDGIVYLQGTIGSGSGSPFTLPVGFRPTQQVKVATSGASGAYAMYLMNTDGTITPIVTAGGQFCLEVCFPSF